MRDAPTTRFSLLARLGDANDQLAWGEFVTLYEPAIYRFARMMGIQDADAREIVQDVLLHVGKSSANRSIKDLRSFRSWLAVATRNRVIDAIRSRQRRDDQMERFAETMASRSGPCDPMDREWTNALRRQMFLQAAAEVRSKIDPKQWDAFFQTAVEMQPAGEVASRLQMTVGNVYVARCRVIERLRKIVSRLSVEDLEATR